jgi:hypothetical protein
MLKASQPLKSDPARRDSGPHLLQRAQADAEAGWDYYPRLEPGVYPGYCRWAKHYWDNGFRRWTCLLRFDLLSNDLIRTLACVPWWLNLGSAEKPTAKRRSRYFAEWVRANGQPPQRVDRLSPRVFVYRMARIEIGDTRGAAPYSVVRKIVEWQTDNAGSVTQSTSHTVKEGIGKVQ